MEVSGVVDLATREALNALLDDWRAKLHVLRCRADQLLSQPSDADLDRIDSQGFLRTALHRLRSLASDEKQTGEQRDLARRALEILYAEHLRTPGGDVGGAEVRR